MKRRIMGFYISVILLVIGVIVSSFGEQVKEDISMPKLNSNLELENLAIDSVNKELPFKYQYKFDKVLPIVDLASNNINKNNTKQEAKGDKKEAKKEKKEDNKIVTEKKVTTQNKYGTNKKTTTTIKYEVKNDNKKQISKKKTTKYSVSEKLLKEANDWYEKESSYMKESLKYVNKYRKNAKAGNVKLDKDLCISAYIRVYEISKSNKFSHTRPDNRRCFTVLKDLKINYYYAGENLAMGSFDSPENVVSAWAASKGHYKNLVMPQYKKVGLAYIKVGDTYYWAQMFTS